MSLLPLRERPARCRALSSPKATQGASRGFRGATAFGRPSQNDPQVSDTALGLVSGLAFAPSNSMLADLFRDERRPLVLAIFGTAASLASIVFFPLLGWVGQHDGWRAMFIACGAPGLLLALLFGISVREPRRGSSEREPRGLRVYSILEAVGFLLGSPAYLFILLASMFMGATVYAGSTWNSSFLVRIHHLPLGQVAASIGPIQGLAGGVGILLGGTLTDRLGERDERWRL